MKRSANRPLTEVEAPRLDWIGTSFGLTLPLHKFWTRAGMKMLYLRQTKNELTGEHSSIMVRALPKRTGFDDVWLSAFVSDTRRRLISLLGGPFRDMEARLAISVLESLNSDDVTTKNAKRAVAERSGVSGEKITADELETLMTPHDLKRLELYGRNLCDHHLVTDLLPFVARLYFTGRFGSDFSISSVQSALMCGIGLQNRSVDSITDEIGLPANQVLAMFNKAVRKMSIALNTIVEEREKKAMLHGEKRKKAEETAEKMRDVSRQTLEEDVQEAATDAMEALNAANAQSILPPEIANDPQLMQYAIKGSTKQWEKALEGKDLDGAGTVQIQSTREKRKLDEEDLKKEEKNSRSKHGSGKKDKKKKSRRSKGQ